ncbi:helix-turn-helix domain-containing protein [Paenibacillus sp. GCM10023252]|uniref:helix-turn-helix transcriptional regulator n=1 Tax=Paenibacillus sp. GCM10023252 TaxID=3252649 RepID=UPI003615B74C
MSRQLYTLAPSETLEELQEIFYPPYITLAHMFHAPEQWAIRSRVLKQYQLQYVLEGEAIYQIEGISYGTKRGDLIFHGPGELHSVETLPRKPYVCISVVFHFGETEFPVRDFIGFEGSSSNSPHLMGSFSDHPLENKLSELVHHYRHPGLYHQQMAQHLLLGILLTLADRKRGDDEMTKEAAGTAKLILVRNYIDAHMKEGFRHQQLEQLTGWSRNYIITQFKRLFGMSPLQYLVWIRLERAKQLALQSGYSFGQIAEEVGYADIHAFGKIFKKKTGMSLSQFVATLFRDTPDR